ncbi:hypothetical protein AFLA_003761 [Aspergillus flavus NRRL3357]|nr:hypothetical protein AFLA_003761 [Aspergillus flavus NRRL3357]
MNTTSHVLTKACTYNMWSDINMNHDAKTSWASKGAAHAKVLVEDLGGNKPYSFSRARSRIVQYDSI